MDYKAKLKLEDLFDHWRRAENAADWSGYRNEELNQAAADAWAEYDAFYQLCYARSRDLVMAEETRLLGHVLDDEIEEIEEPYLYGHPRNGYGL